MTQNGNLDPLLDIAHAAALAGGRAIQPFLSDGFEVKRKADNTPVTDADMAAHHAILEYLREATPAIPVLSEESAPADIEGSASWEEYWCVDPIDGTSEFVAGRESFTVNVALVRGGRSLLGAVQVPVSGACYWGAAGAAWKQVGDAAKHQIRTRRVSGDRISMLASRTRKPELVQRCVDAIEASGRAVEKVHMGSSLKFCLVAEGTADFFPQFGATHEWDTAAAQAVVEAAGGGVYTAGGAALSYQKPGLKNPGVYTWGDDQLDWVSWIAAD